jgi:hypothetical protein
MFKERIAILITRNVNCSELTKEQFVTMMMEDLKRAPIKSEEIFRPELEAEFYHNQEQHREYVEKRAREYACKKWKTDKKRDQYVLDVLSKEKINVFEFSPVSYFDLKLNPHENFISGSCCLTVDSSEEKLERCYEMIKDNKYFLSATGWELIESRSFRSRIKLIMPDEMNEMYRKEEEGLANAIANFYAGCRYWGD